jgi:hypothetical protein
VAIPVGSDDVYVHDRFDPRDGSSERVSSAAKPV